jgi:outer membrane protein W
MSRLALILALLVPVAALAQPDDDTTTTKPVKKAKKKPAPAKQKKTDDQPVVKVDDDTPAPAKKPAAKKPSKKPAKPPGDDDETPAPLAGKGSKKPAKPAKQTDDSDVPAPVASKKKPAKPSKKKAPDPEPEIEMDPVAAAPTPTPPPPTPTPEPEAKPSGGIDLDVSVRVAVKRPSLKRLYVRAGVAYVAPLSQSKPIELSDVDGAASLAIDNGPIAGSGATVGTATIPAAIVGYKLSDRIAVETILGLPFTVKLKGTGTIANQSLAPMALGIPTGVPPLGEDLGEAKAAPPTVTLKYDLTGGAVRPYVGAGASVLIAYNAHVTNPILTMVGKPSMTIDPAPGLVLQGGLDAKLYKNWYARLDVKFIALMLARAKVEHIQVATPDLPVFGSVEVGTAKASVWVNPLIIQAGIGADF